MPDEKSPRTNRIVKDTTKVMLPIGGILAVAWFVLWVLIIQPLDKRTEKVETKVEQIPLNTQAIANIEEDLDKIQSTQSRIEDKIDDIRFNLP